MAGSALVRAEDAADRIVNYLRDSPELEEAVAVVIIAEAEKPTLIPGAIRPLRVERFWKHPGRRIVRLLFPWEEIEPHTHGGKDALNNYLASITNSGGVLRAKIRFLRWEHEQKAGTA